MTSTAQQQPLFIDTVYDALRAAVGALGGPKAVAPRLWPQKSIDDGRRLLLDCLNPDRAEKLDPEQVVVILRWAREAGFHSAKHWLDEATGYQPSQPLDPAVERDRLLTVVEESRTVLARALDQLAAMESKRPLTIAK